MRVLILGGTAEARELAAALHDAGIDVTTSLAGRTEHPRVPAGALRIGGFGGPEGLRAYVAEHAIDVVVDATHPFARRISAAAEHAGVPLIRLERAGWEPRPGDRWVDTLEDAAAECPGHRVLLTTGHQGIAAFAAVRDAWFLVRAITPPDPLPAHHELVLARGPFGLEDERALFERHRIDLLVTKDSGGPAAKLEAARERGCPVVIVRRPRSASVEDVLRRLT